MTPKSLWPSAISFNHSSKSLRYGVLKRNCVICERKRKHWELKEEVSLWCQHKPLDAIPPPINLDRFCTTMATSSRRLIAGLTASIGSIESLNANPAQSVSLICRNQRNGASPIVLRTSQRSRLWLIEAVPPTKSWLGSDDGEDVKKSGARNYAASGTDGHAVAGKDDKTMEIVIAAATTAALGVGNRVLYKLALIPLKQYPFFLAQLSTFG